MVGAGELDQALIAADPSSWRSLDERHASMVQRFMAFPELELA